MQGVESGIDDLSGSGYDTDQGSVERSRTAWNTSIGHRRISMDEINERFLSLAEIIIFALHLSSCYFSLQFHCCVDLDKFKSELQNHT